MKTMVWGLALLLAGCDLLPQKPLTDKEVASTDTTKLCQWSGYYFGQGSIREFQMVRAELARRNALTPECVSIAQMQMNADANAAAKRAAMAQAISQAGRDIANQPKPVVCQSSQTSKTTVSTNCQ
jgi:hypothetical protein